jgi:hypothetical protein
MTFKVLNLHHTRVRAESEEAEKEQNSEQARHKRERKKIIDFDHHYRKIDH